MRLQLSQTAGPTEFIIRVRRVSDESAHAGINFTSAYRSTILGDRNRGAFDNLSDNLVGCDFLRFSFVG